MTQQTRSLWLGQRRQNNTMGKIMPTKSEAASVIKQDAQFFYVYGIVLVIFASYVSVREQDAAYFTLLIAAMVLVVPACVTATVYSRIAAGLLVFFAFAQIVGAAVSFRSSVSGFLNVLFSVGLFFLALRMFVATIRLNKRDTIES